ncbi:helix-turn-helix domain-containing protein [Actinoallomurus sp. CA-142502]|uniref:helix-turn-helix domain-containing protein n=1 Tax=Actinoallomurus sp. CA-142502 TaxID=3239885 RepID=UPI003D90D598
MHAKPSPDPMISMWTWLAHDVRFYRTRAKMSGTRLGELLGCDRSTISRIESATLKIDDKQAKILDRIFDTGGHFLRLLRYAELGHDPDWFKAFIGYERVASSIRIYEALTVTGLLQTERYARALLEASRIVDDVEQALDIRKARQTALLVDPPPNVWLLLNEPIIRQPVGGPEVMKEQLEHLLAVSRLPHISVRVIPTKVGAHCGLDGSFCTLESPTSRAAYSSAMPGGRLILAAAEIDWYKEKFEQLGADALSRSASREMIKQAMEEFK